MFCSFSVNKDAADHVFCGGDDHTAGERKARRHICGHSLRQFWVSDTDSMSLQDRLTHGGPLAGVEENMPL